ncbi:histidine kinase [Streptomyces sp. NPDC050211]|uniref:histidine kinase n=1 Tax=Streptomyces sp. NPDC050211 TaxID=3154932 RepID=UPI003415B6CE
MRLQLDAAARVLESSSHPRSLVASASKEASRGLDEVRRIIDDLRPPVLDDCGLATAVATLATHFNTASLTVACSISPCLPNCPPQPRRPRTASRQRP